MVRRPIQGLAFIAWIAASRNLSGCAGESYPHHEDHGATYAAKDISPRTSRRARSSRDKKNEFLRGLRALRGKIVFLLSIRQLEMNLEKNLRNPRKLSGIEYGHEGLGNYYILNHIYDLFILRAK